MGKILVYTNLTGSTNVTDVESYLQYSGHDFIFQNIYHNHCRHNHSQYDRVFALIDASCHVVSDEFRQDLLRRVKILYNKNTKIVLFNFWESRNQILHTEYVELLKDYNYAIWDGSTTYFWFKMYERYKNHKFDFNHTYKNYNFLYLNKTQRNHRDLLFDELMKENILSNSLYSYHHRGIKLNPDFEIKQYKNFYPEYGADRDIYEKPYNETVFNIVSETSVDELFITEKTWKPIIAKQLFIVHSKTNFLNDIKKLGFKTYNDLIDETYDTIPNLKEKTSAIVSLCKSLKNVNHLELYYNSQNIREHNLSTLFSQEKLHQAIKNNFNELFKLVDNR